jgi:hypothetical protein
VNQLNPLWPSGRNADDMTTPPTSPLPPEANSGTPQISLTSIRENRRAHLRTIIEGLNNTSPECLEAIDALQIMNLQDEVLALRTAHEALQGELEGAQGREDQLVRERDEFHDELAAAQAALTEGEKDTTRIAALVRLYTNCPHAELTYNDDQDDGLVGWSLNVDGCEPLSMFDSTLRGLCDRLAAMKEGA